VDHCLANPLEGSGRANGVAYFKGRDGHGSPLAVNIDGALLEYLVTSDDGQAVDGDF
jgi:hypothetical protein